jgi:hypothetical protein
MTRDEILKLEAGREIDVLIAEHVFGDAEPENKYRQQTKIFQTTLVKITESTYGGTWAYNFAKWIWEPYPFSSDDAITWKIVRRLDELGLSFNIVKHAGEKRYIAEFWKLRPETTADLIYENIAEAETPALAICRAALLAVMGVKE